MKRKGYLTVALALTTLALALAACGSQPSTENPAPAEAVEQAPAENPADAPIEPVEQAPMEEPVEAPVEEKDSPASDGTIFQISEESEARFVIDEVLDGAPKTVVGTTNSVTGEILADYTDPAAAQVSALSVDLSTLATDNNFRNGALHEFILQTNNPDFQFAEFVSTSISGLPESVAVGESYPIQITGDLTIHGVTREVTFDATVTPVSETRLEGSASTTVNYADFDVKILRLPDRVASVEDTARLEIDLVALAQ